MLIYSGPLQAHQIINLRCQSLLTKDSLFISESNHRGNRASARCPNPHPEPTGTRKSSTAAPPSSARSGGHPNSRF